MTPEQANIVAVLEASNELDYLNAARLIREQDDEIEYLRKHAGIGCRSDGSNYPIVEWLWRFLNKWSRHDSHCGIRYGSHRCTCGFWDELDELKKKTYLKTVPAAPDAAPCRTVRSA